ATALILEDDAHAGVEEGQLPQALGQVVEVEGDIGKGLRGGDEVNAGAGGTGFTHHSQRRLGHTVLVDLLPDLAAAADGQLELLGQGIHHGNAHPVQTAGHLVGVVVELTTGVKHRHDYFGGGYALFMGFGGNAAPVVRHRDGFVRVDGHGNLTAVAGQRLVDGVVHQFEDHVVQACAVVRVPDVHPGTLADRIESLENLD